SSRLVGLTGGLGMRKKPSWTIEVVGGAVLIAAPLVSAGVVTGNFTGPLTTGVLLSVDINGGPITSANSTTEGSNGPSGSPVLSADPYGVLWSPWGGP